MLDNVPSFYVFNIFSVALTVLIAIITCFFAVHFSRQIKQGENSIVKKGSYSFILAFCFWLKNIVIVLTVNLPFQMVDLIIYATLSFIFTFIGSFFTLQIAQNMFLKPLHFIRISIVIAISILCADSLGFLYLFAEFIEFKAILFIMANVLILGTAFSLIRFLTQMTNEEGYNMFSGWQLFGCVTVGFSLAGIPYVVLVSLFTFDSIMPASTEQLLFLVPFIFLLNANLVLGLVPDLIGQKLAVKNVQSYLSLFHHNPDTVFSVSSEGIITDVNKEVTRLLGYKPQQLIGLHINHFLRDENQLVNMNEALTGASKLVETKLTNKKGETLDVKITIVRIVIDGKITGLYGIVKDITEQKRAEKKNHFLAYHDELTQLPNRRYFEQTIAQLIVESQTFSLLYIDFDRFKRINDTFGHLFGDRILEKIGEKLTAVLQEDCVVARLAGDEFAVMVPSHFDSKEIAENILAEFNLPIKIDGSEFTLTASIGISEFPKDAKTAEEMLKYADIAMYAVKEYGSNHYKIFDKSMIQQTKNKMYLENDLRKAIEQESLTVYFQPKYNLRTKEVIGSEALVRWDHPKHGFLSPLEFISLAEETNLIVGLERVVMKKVFQSLQAWKTSGLKPPRTSINVSFIHFYQEDFVPYLIDKLADFGLKGSDIEVEITERMIVKGQADVNKKLKALREVGVEISVDDFGTGYSSLSYLVNLSVDRLKIDKSFISNFNDNKEIISTIISMSKNLNLSVIAEGVETEEQIRLLEDLQCVEVQGFYYSRPIAGEDFQLLLERGLTPSAVQR
ncbi:putative bifunctional diguanylate cyclase/phosphodiesterase [Halalkalibacter akibai]|uniref:Diguanylate cyclase/phosphodiesterase n=1 Tax=Halalkalibacter akibai (strain ATCC 43226 / DSM 21942 / CIP 109018 / JCM 9157 / 1139) TaxID=1236973 RepID=W4QQU8_HALA3|nr:EAL domain-containing protein [Halalkalibacter akibai]GAE33729.1 diguanylate cyclase/phosphodiesterase [Halalkalibacter akibai JCM 9157]